MGCHFLLQGNLPDPGIKPSSPAWQADSLLLSLLEGRVVASHLASSPSQMCVAPPALGGGLGSRTKGCRDQGAGVRGPSAPAWSALHVGTHTAGPAGLLESAPLHASLHLPCDPPSVLCPAAPSQSQRLSARVHV